MNETNFTNHIKISEEKCEAISARVFLSHLPALVVSGIHVRANRRFSEDMDIVLVFAYGIRIKLSSLIRKIDIR